MVSALVSGSSGPGSSPQWSGRLCYTVRQDTSLTVPLHKGDKWVPANLMLRVTQRWTSSSWRGSRVLEEGFR